MTVPICPDCKDTGEITLLTSKVPCDCVTGVAPTASGFSRMDDVLPNDPQLIANLITARLSNRIRHQSSNYEPFKYGWMIGDRDLPLTYENLLVHLEVVENQIERKTPPGIIYYMTFAHVVYQHVDNSLHIKLKTIWQPT